MAKAKNVSGFPSVDLSNVTIAKVTTVKKKSELSMKLELESAEAEQLASFAHLDVVSLLSMPGWSKVMGLK